MTREEIEKLRNDPRNTKWGIYCCKEDPRVIVPKTVKWMGWTVNFGHAMAIPTLLLVFVILLVPFLIVTARGAGPVEVFAVLAISIVLVTGLSAWLSSRSE